MTSRGGGERLNGSALDGCRVSVRGSGTGRAEKRSDAGSPGDRNEALPVTAGRASLAGRRVAAVARRSPQGATARTTARRAHRGRIGPRGGPGQGRSRSSDMKDVRLGIDAGCYLAGVKPDPAAPVPSGHLCGQRDCSRGALPAFLGGHGPDSANDCGEQVVVLPFEFVERPKNGKASVRRNSREGVL